jgi:uncharacterized membrane protein
LRGTALAADEERPETGSTLSKDRMEALSDGVLAFAITLLVIDLAVRPPGSPLEQFLHEWPAYLAYVISFLTIGAAWLGHHALTNRMDRVDPIFLGLNLLFLLLVTFLPFPTRLVGAALHQSTAGERVATVVYGLTLLGVRLFLSVLIAYSRGEHLQRPGADDADMRDTRRKLPFVLVAYCITIILSLFVPVAGVVIYFAVAVYLVVPFRAVARALSTRHSQ